MKLTCKNLLSSALILFVSSSIAQSVPKITYQDYGFEKPVKQVAEFYYSFDNDSIEKVEKLTYRFNKHGKIESIANKSFLDDSWSKATMRYRKKVLHKEFWENSNPYLSRTYTYLYNKQGQIIEQKIRFKDGEKSSIRFTYQKNLIAKIEAEIDGFESVTSYFYSTNGKLYKEIQSQKKPNETEIKSQTFYLENQEILSFVEPKSYFLASAYLDGVAEIHFKLVDDTLEQNKLMKNIIRFDREAALDRLPFDLQTYSEQTLETYRKNKDKLLPVQIKLFIRDIENHKLAEAEIDIQTKAISGIGFFKIEFADGTIHGDTNFDKKAITYFEELRNKINIP